MIPGKLRILDDNLGIGRPRKLYDTVRFIFVQSYLGHASAIVLTLLLTTVKRGDRDEYIFILSVFDYIGCILPVLVAPFVDNVRGHRLWNVSCLCVSAATLLASFAMTMTMSLDIVIPVAIFAGVVTFTNIFIVGYEAQQVDDPIGTRTRLLLSIHFTCFAFVKGVSQLALFWNPTVIEIMSKILIVFTPLMMLVLAGYLYRAKNRFIVAQCNPGDAFLVLNCILRVFKFSFHGILFDRMLQYYSFAVVASAKKACKLFLLSLSFSMIESLGILIQREWIHQYVLTKRTGLFQYIEFNTLTSLLTALFIPVVEFGLVPMLRKLKQPFPMFSLLIIAGYIFCMVGHACSLWTEYRTETIRQCRLKGRLARVYVYNALDTNTHIWLTDHQATIPSGSMASVVVTVPEDNSSLSIHVLNPWYIASYSLALANLEPLNTNAFVLTNDGAYEIPSEGFVRQSAVSPRTPADTTLTFICPKKVVDGSATFNVWCSAKVYLHSGLMTMSESPFDMEALGDASVIPVRPGAVFRVLVEIQQDYNYDPHPIAFRPLQGGKYVFAMWPGDTQIEIKRRIITLLEPFPINAYSTLPQIIFWALGQALYRSSLNTVFVVNGPPAVLVTTWTLRLACVQLWTPLLVTMRKFEYTDAKHQLVLVVIELLLFVVLLVALRAARYRGS